MKRENRVITNKAKAYLKDQFKDSGDSSWLEGWICGFTDQGRYGVDTDTIHDELFEFLKVLRG